MTVREIKAAVDHGHAVYWRKPHYRVVKDRLGQYLIQCLTNGHCVFLTRQDGEMGLDPAEFFTKG